MIGAYRDRLQGASPDQAASQIAQLQGELSKATQKLQILDPDNYRTLKDSQIKYLTDHQDDLRKNIKALNIYARNVGDSLSYAYEFMTLFQKFHISEIGAFTTLCRKGETGILVGLKNPDAPS